VDTEDSMSDIGGKIGCCTHYGTGLDR